MRPSRPTRTRLRRVQSRSRQHPRPPLNSASELFAAYTVDACRPSREGAVRTWTPHARCAVSVVRRERAPGRHQARSRNSRESTAKWHGKDSNQGIGAQKIVGRSARTAEGVQEAPRRRRNRGRFEDQGCLGDNAWVSSDPHFNAADLPVAEQSGCAGLAGGRLIASISMWSSSMKVRRFSARARPTHI